MRPGSTTSSPISSTSWARPNIRVSLFIEPSEEQVAAAVRLGAPVVEFHTGRYAHVEGEERAAELKRIADAAALAAKNGIEPHAGHGLTFDNVVPVAAIPQLAELNIGHFLVGEAIFTGLEDSVRRMRGIDGRSAVIVGIGSDLCNIERIQASVDRFGDRFLNRVFTDDRAGQGGAAAAHHGRDAGQALRRQGGLFQGGRHRLQARRLYEGYRRGECAVGRADAAADRRRQGAA